MLAGCASTQAALPSSQDAAATEDCTRFEAAAHAYGDMFNPLKMQKRSIEDCSQGYARACVAAPIAIPFTILVGVVTAPLLLPILMSTPNIQRTACPDESSATSVDAPPSDAQPDAGEASQSEQRETP